MSSALVDNKNRILLSMSVAEESIDFTSSIETAISILNWSYIVWKKQ